MKVDIGPFPRDLIPIRRWERDYECLRGHFLGNEPRTWYDKIIYKTLDTLETVFRPINRWSNSRTRKEKVRVDYYDIIEASHTLALVIHPVLLRLQKEKQGSPCVDKEDVPEHLRPTEEAGPDNGYTDNTIHDRWDWVLNEMIWAFEQYTKPDNNTDQFHHNIDQLEMIATDTPNGMKSITFNKQKNPAKPKYWVDYEGKKMHYDRIKNGLNLFAKYYFALWD